MRHLLHSQPHHEILDAALEHLPSTLPWLGPVAWAASIFLLTMIGLRLSLAYLSKPLPSLQGSPWYLRARFLSPMGHYYGIMCVLVLAIGTLGASMFVGPLSAFSTKGAMLLGLAASYAALEVGGIDIYHRITERKVSIPTDLRTTANFWLIHRPGLLVGIITAFCMPMIFQTGTAIALAVGAIVVTALLFGGTDLLLRWIGSARPAPAELRELADEVSDKASVPIPKIAVLEDVNANAICLLPSKQVYITRPLLEGLTRDQLRSLLFFEAGSLIQRSNVLPIRILGSYAYLALAGAYSCGVTYGLHYALIVIVLYFVLQRLIFRSAKKGVVDADRIVKELQQENAPVHAQALERLSEINRTPLVAMADHPLHPHTYDRMVEAGVQPDYPRPAPPPKDRFRLALIFSLTLLFIPGVLRFFSEEIFASQASRNETAWALHNALVGGDASSFVEKGWSLFEAGKGEEAYDLLHAATVMEPWHPMWSAELAHLTGQLGKNDEKASWIEETQSLLEEWDHEEARKRLEELGSSQDG